MGRGVMSVLAGIGVLIAIGLVLTHSTQTTQIASGVATALDTTIRDLSLQPVA